MTAADLPDDDGDLPVDETPEPPPADPRLLAQANGYLVDRVRELEAEISRLRSSAKAWQLAAETLHDVPSVQRLEDLRLGNDWLQTLLNEHGEL